MSGILIFWMFYFRIYAGSLWTQYSQSKSKWKPEAPEVVNDNYDRQVCMHVF